MTKITVLDGSYALQVSSHVRKDPDGDPLWTARFLLTDPEAVTLAHLDFLRAGSDIIETNTYQASVTGFRKYLNYDEAQSLELIKKAVVLAKEAVKTYEEELQVDDSKVNRKPLIAGSCGPYGATLHDASEYTGIYDESITKEFLKDWHRSKVRALVEAGVDLLALETVPCAVEAEALVEILREFPDTKAWLTFSCAAEGTTLVDGSDFKETALKAWNSALPGQLIGVGLNCLAPRHVTRYLKSIHGTSEGKSVPLVVYPNSGETYSPEKGWSGDGGDKLRENDRFVHEWLNNGVQFIGGCCRTGAEDVAKIRERVEAWKGQERETSL